jgi:threonine synthase
MKFSQKNDNYNSMNVTHLYCSACGKEYRSNELHNLCTDCGKPLLVSYDLNKVSETLTKESLKTRVSTLWRYEEILPVENIENRITLGEGWTPLHHAKNLGKKYDLPNLFIKDESINPTQSFKARGITMAVSMAKELGVEKVAVPSAGNAAGALSAYAALAGMEAHIFVPMDTPRACIIECKSLGANVNLIDGLITDCGKIVGERKDAEGWFDVSTLKEPYRIEGKKTMGYELAEQMDWNLPDVIFYPTGGGTGLIGMWKAFDEMEEMGWIDSKRPRMVSVQSEGCSPIVDAFHQNLEHGAEIENPNTVASGLRVPKAIGDFIMLDILRKSGGTAVAVSDVELVKDSEEIGKNEGIFAAPEGGALLAALKKLLKTGEVQKDEQIVLFNTGSGIKYLEAFE